MPRFFVALDSNRQPISQRSAHSKNYVAASYDGESFSSTGPNGSYPRQVVEVTKPIEWVARATLPDQSKVWNRSKAAPVARNYVAYTYTTNASDVQRKAEPDRLDDHAWTDAPNFDAWLAENIGLHECDVKQRAFVVGDLAELRNWPAPGHVVVLSDPVRP